MKKQIEILFEDNELLVVNKPSGITVIPSRDITLPSLQRELEKTYGKLFTVHRLDRETSGVLCFAKNETAHRNLSMQFENHSVKKYYQALVHGRMESKSGEIQFAIASHPSKPNVMITHPKGKPSLSVYRELEAFKHATLLEVEIKTGRTHQVRVHLAAISHPLLVDIVYGKHQAGKQPGFYLSSVKKNYKTGEDEKPVISRLTLHAAELRFVHPLSGEWLACAAVLPDDLQAVLKLLRKYDS